MQQLLRSSPSFIRTYSFSPFWVGSVVIWLLILIATPISIWVIGEHTFPFVASMGVLAQFVATIIGLQTKWNWQRIVFVVSIVAVLTWVAEFTGHSTGLPFGEYSYSNLLQPQLAGVPLLIPLAWMMMLAPSWAIAEAILGEKPSRFALALIAGVAMMAWDFYLDPQMVGKGLWVWHQPGGYFGIPWLNYAGWLLTASLVTWVINPRDCPRTPLLIIYSLTWIFQAIGLGVFWGQPGPAMVGFVAMGVLSMWSWQKEYERWLSSSATS